MKNSISLLFLLLIIISLSVVGCKKPNEVVALGDSGHNIVKLFANSANVYRSYLSLSTTSQTVKVMELRRDMVSNSDLNKPMTVVLTLDPTLVTKYNTDKEADLIAPPAGSYSFATANPLSGNNITVNFAPGEFEKDIKIIIPNGTLFDPANNYALGFKIASVDNQGVISAEHNSLVAHFSAKNQYDGVYVTTGNMADAVAPALTGPYPWNTALVTTGPNEVWVLDLDYTEDYYHKIINGGSSSYYGAFGVAIVLDPATNKVTEVYNIYGQPSSNGRSAQLDPSGVNTWDPVKKVLKVKYWMNQPGPNHRTSFDETFTFKRDR